MSNTTDLVNEVYQRIITRMTAGQPLENVKRVRIGTIEEARKLNDLPVINIQVSNGQEVARSTSKALVCRMSIFCTLIHSKSTGNNTLWDTVNGVRVGALPTFEKMLNALDTSTGGTADMDFGGYADNMKSVSWTIREDADVVECEATISVDTKVFYVKER